MTAVSIGRPTKFFNSCSAIRSGPSGERPCDKTVRSSSRTRSQNGNSDRPQVLAVDVAPDLDALEPVVAHHPFELLQGEGDVLERQVGERTIRPACCSAISA